MLFLFKTYSRLQTIFIRIQRDTSKTLPCQGRFKKIAGQGLVTGKFGHTLPLFVTKIQSSIHTARWTVLLALQDSDMATHSHASHRILKQMAQQLDKRFSEERTSKPGEIQNSPSLRSCSRFSWHEKSSFTLMFTVNVATFPGFRGNCERVSSSFQLKKSPYSFSVLK